MKPVIEWFAGTLIFVAILWLLIAFSPNKQNWRMSPEWNRANATDPSTDFQSRGEMYYREDGSIGYYPPEDAPYNPFLFEVVHDMTTCFDCHSGLFITTYCIRCHPKN